MTDYALFHLARQIHRARPAKLVFLDHRPNPAGLIRALRAVYAPENLPPLFFHVYGDFSLDARDWVDIEPALKGCFVRFVAASSRQREFVARAIYDGSEAVSVCPFPVDVAEFKSDPEAGNLFRRARGVKPGELVIGYSGRLSLQKNTDRLLEEFAKLVLRSRTPPPRLWFAGGFDDIGAPFFGVRSPPGRYFQSWNSKLESLPQKARERVEYLGLLSGEELRAFYNAVDLYASLSLHHDEDFGMAPAEALCCGTPAVLTSWGGYASFRSESDGDAHCRLIPVNLDRAGLDFSTTDVEAAIMGFLAPLAPAERAKRAKLYASRLSIEAANGFVRAIHARPAPVFKGFHWRFQELARIVTNQQVYRDGPCRGSFYEEIYGSYLGDSTNQLASLAQ